jgi:hypothetical protein
MKGIIMSDNHIESENDINPLDTIRMINELISGNSYMVKNHEEFAKEAFIAALDQMNIILEKFVNPMQMHVEVEQLIEKHDNDNPQ